MDSVHALVAVHTTERSLFARMINMNMNSELSRKIMAYWMHLESEGFKDLLKKLSSHDDKFLSLVCLEAETVLSSLVQPNSTTPISLNSLPITLNLANPSSLSPLAIFEQRERVSKGVSDLYEGVCSMIFEDILEERGLRGSFGKGKSVGTMMDIVGKLVKAGGGGESTCENGGAASGGGGGGAGSSSGFRLNPDAKEWYPSLYPVSEADRCLYLTFSNGFPLTRTEVWKFFRRIFGNGVESVYVHQPLNGPPLFGKVVFTERYMPALILDGSEEVRFYIEDKTVWCKKYQPKDIRNNGSV